MSFFTTAIEAINSFTNLPVYTATTKSIEKAVTSLYKLPTHNIFEQLGRFASENVYFSLIIGGTCLANAVIANTNKLQVKNDSGKLHKAAATVGNIGYNYGATLVAQCYSRLMFSNFLRADALDLFSKASYWNPGIISVSAFAGVGAGFAAYRYLDTKNYSKPQLCIRAKGIIS